MTDNKSWLWRKRSSEKSIVITDKVDLTSKGNEEEIHVLLAEKAELERDLRDLSDKLSSALSECDAKDELAKKHAKTAQEALAGWEKAEAKALSLQQELDEALKQREICEERTTHLDAALKECMQQLRFVREDQEKRIHDVLLKASKELEETKMFLGENLAESDKKIAKLTADNSQLNNMVMLKEQVIEDLTQQRATAEADLNALVARLESLEKENNSLRYEVRILEKEVDIRNEEREFNRRSADAVHKQHLENVKKIAKLESECQRLRVLVRKRLPGPASLAKMKSEVDILQRDSVGIRRKKSNSNLGNLQLDYAVDNYPDSPGKKINILTEKICTLEEENNSLREALQQKLTELQVSRNMYAKTASTLSQVEMQLEESPKGRIVGDTRRNSLVSHDLSLSSMSDVGSDGKASCAGSWASALISELEQFRDGKDKVALPPKSSVRISDINHFMDDFAEMEKLALVCVDKPIEYSSPTKNNSSFASLSETTGKELALVSSTIDAYGATETRNRQLPSKLSESVSKLIEIIEGINLSSQACDGLENLSGKNGSYCAHKNVEIPTGYTVRVLQWKTSDLASVLHGFLRACVDLLNRKVDFEMFTEELTTALEWIINHCFSLQDVSGMKDEIKKQLDWDETKSESEVELGISGTAQISEAAKIFALKQQLQRAANGHHSETHCDLNTEGKSDDLARNVGSAKHELELQSLKNDCDSLRTELQRSESIVASLQVELEALKHSKSMADDQLENYKMRMEDLDSQLSVVKSELHDAGQKFASLEAQFKEKGNLCEELEAKCLDLQRQLERVTRIDSLEHVEQDEKQLRTEQELSAASEKLAECQDTILYLGKQLRALASSRDTVVSDKFISTPTNTNTSIIIKPTNPTPSSEKKLTSHRSSLLDKMLAEDDEAEQLGSPKTKEVICPKDFGYEPSKEYVTGKKYNGEITVGPLAIVPSKKKHTSSGGLIKKLLWRRKRGNSQKMPLPFAA